MCVSGSGGWRCLEGRILSGYFVVVLVKLEIPAGKWEGRVCCVVWDELIVIRCTIDDFVRITSGCSLLGDARGKAPLVSSLLL